MSSDDEGSAYSFGGNSSGSDFAPTATSTPAKRKNSTATPKKDTPAKKTAGPPAKKQKLDKGTAAATDAIVASPGPKKKAAGKGTKTIEETYQRKTPLEHILLRPDTYIGSVEAETVAMWVVEGDRMVNRNVKYVPGLYKIFDEILSNAADNKIRDPSMDTIKVDIDRANNCISVYNNGRGIPVEIHAEEKVYVPELIFGHLLTSSNYDDDEKKVTGGRNGYGAKLCNIFSKEFVVETSSSESGHKFRQVFNDNMSKRGSPKLIKAAKDDFTKITFKPDLARFGMAEMDDDLEAVLRKRVYDIAGVVRDVKVFLNGDRIKIKTFKDYVKLYLDAASQDGKAPPIVYERPNDRWEVCFATSDGQAQQVSFVNSICTIKGGTHVSSVVDQIVSAATEALKKKDKTLNPKPHQIKNNIMVFINALIENPTFDSQTKENMTLKPSKFGSKCTLSEDFLKKVMKSGLLENVMAMARAKQDRDLKKTDGSKRTRISGITKLDDANNAGTKHGQGCTLILTEGDSAKALAISGLSVVGRDNFGVFPLRGKLLNVRDASKQAVISNAEINNIKQIMGLKSGQEYNTTDSLRYGHIMIMTDQDHDGSHIKGLLINLFDAFWPSLLQRPGFLLQFITPIVKVSKGDREVNFYTIPEYESWKEAHNDGKRWNIKYYKGLGTSTAADAKKYFSRMDDHLKPFKTVSDEDRQRIDLAFNKKKSDERKEWLKGFTQGTFIDNSVEEIPISDFVDKELILFSMADNVRSIPSIVDGLKPGQRKILFSCFKRNLTKQEIKVAQLAGYVSEHSAYHHGEASLCATIVGLAQDFVGSNNLNLLEPRGQFGTRLQGGKDSAHARYIFTRLSPVARMLFHPSDDKLLAYQNEENMMIEPEWYIPILPLVLVNGAEGIGTGWATNIPNYNPRDIVANLRRLMDGEDLIEMHPWWRKFKGTVETNGDKCKISGTIRKLDNTTLEITELPIQSWTQPYKEFLEGMMKSDEGTPFIKDYKEYHTDTAVHFVVSLTEENMAKAEAEGFDKRFKMSTTKHTSNMVLFDAEGKLKKYESVREILEEFYGLRLDHYAKRKEWLIGELTREWTKLDNQVRFIQEVIAGTLVVQNRKRADIVQDLAARKYSPIEKTKDGDAPDAAQEGDENETTRNGYDYLLSMPIWNLTKEKVDKLKEDRDKKLAELEVLKNTPPKNLWREDLDKFMAEWDRIEAEGEAALKAAATTKGRKGAKVNVTAARLKSRQKKKAQQIEEWDSDVGGDADDGDYTEKRATNATLSAPRKAPPRRKPAPVSTTPSPTDKMDVDDFFDISFGTKGNSSTTKATVDLDAVKPEDSVTEGIKPPRASTQAEPEKMQKKITDLFRPNATSSHATPLEVPTVKGGSQSVAKSEALPKPAKKAKAMKKPSATAAQVETKPKKETVQSDHEDRDDDPFAFPMDAKKLLSPKQPGGQPAGQSKQPVQTKNPAKRKARVIEDESDFENDLPVSPPKKRKVSVDVELAMDDGSPVRRSSRSVGRPRKAAVILDSEDEGEEWVEDGQDDEGSSYDGE
ncbi:DNA topoisomerase 2 [Rhizophlyctis rosea]|nr:DNA topoisomerase 2 [Rhizophlyctis rosea]